MGSGGRKRGAGERVLESRHVIGLFMLMLLFSGVFFTLGYVMGRNQFDGQVRAAGNPRVSADVASTPKPAPPAKPAKNPRAENVSSSAANPDANADWEFYNAGKPNSPVDSLKPLPSVPATKTVAAVAKGKIPPKASNVSTKPSNAVVASGGAYTLQVAALRKESVALSLATHLQRKKFPAFVVSPQSDKYYRVQVGPYADPKSADAAKKGLEDAGFKAIVKH